MTLTRWRLAATVVLAVGLVAAARVADDEKTPWKQELRGGETVELIGVSTQPLGPKTWWGPDGRSLDRPPFDGLGSSTTPDEQKKARVFAIRVSGGRVDQSPAVSWDIPKASATGISHPPRWEGKPAEPGVYGAAATLPGDAPTCTIRVGVVGGEWQTEATSSGQGIQGGGSSRGGILFAKARAVAGGTAMVVAHNLSGVDIRIVAVDNDGNEQGPSPASAVGSGGIQLHDMEFKLPPGRIREFRLQTRPYHWAEFRDVPLDPRPSRAKP
jgi:hypothetical protein